MHSTVGKSHRVTLGVGEGGVVVGRERERGGLAIYGKPGSPKPGFPKPRFRQSWKAWNCSRTDPDLLFVTFWDNGKEDHPQNKDFLVS